MTSNWRLRVTPAKNRERVKLKRTDPTAIVSRRGHAPLVIRGYQTRAAVSGWGSLHPLGGSRTRIHLRTSTCFCPS